MDGDGEVEDEWWVREVMASWEKKKMRSGSMETIRPERSDGEEELFLGERSK